jgi:hypothetical protein
MGAKASAMLAAVPMESAVVKGVPAALLTLLTTLTFDRQ